MKWLRDRASAWVLAILMARLASLVAAPMALCAFGLSSSIDEDECCKNLAPGQTCPMHKQAKDSTSGSVLRCGCSAPEAALASIIGLSGILPALNHEPDHLTQLEFVTSSPVQLLSRHVPSSSPPPRVA